MLDDTDSHASKNSAVESVLTEAFATGAYTHLCILAGQVCGVKRFNFTTAVVVGLDRLGHHRRYCYEHQADAQTALLVWDGHEHPSGPWIKCKGAGIDLFNPDYD